ncbi:hypothetical protein [Anaerotignum sp.]|uniref:hypothetical protein n=1 Tax=Anaerotignum sp. TaxID=2039241 RepID=UPI00289906BF|nr:hypothetical protein [Anaerotignum sp.]
MYIVKKENIERIAESKAKYDEYLAQGYTPVQTDEFQHKENELSEMTVEELKAFAAENGIDIGRSASAEGILKKITEALRSFNGGDENGDDKGGEVKGTAGDNNG